MPLDTLETLVTNQAQQQAKHNEDGSLQSSWGHLGESAPVNFTLSAASVHLTPDPSESTANGDYVLPRSRAAWGRQRSFETTYTEMDNPPEHDDDFGPDTVNHPSWRSASQNAPTPFPREAQRTVFFGNLSDKTTHKDLARIIRGGRLLDIYVRHDRSATVSFLEGAQEFVNYAKRNDFYIHSKRVGLRSKGMDLGMQDGTDCLQVEIRWNDRQFHLPGHVANKIAMGATRNVVVRGGAERLSEQIVRDDLDHIHNLVVIDVAFRDGDVYISTNSVHNALFARTCMMSRSLYKGLKIEWFPDECASPLPRTPASSLRVPRAVSKPQKKPSLQTLANRFALLNTDGTEDGSGDEQEFSVQRSDWTAPSAIAV